jgi:hypothetical protein
VPPLPGVGEPASVEVSAPEGKRLTCPTVLDDATDVVLDRDLNKVIICPPVVVVVWTIHDTMEVTDVIERWTFIDALKDEPIEEWEKDEPLKVAFWRSRTAK